MSKPINICETDYYMMIEKFEEQTERSWDWYLRQDLLFQRLEWHLVSSLDWMKWSELHVLWPQGPGSQNQDSETENKAGFRAEHNNLSEWSERLLMTEET